ncbi:MAG: ATP-binding cassette domain-containing protein [Bacteroidetes bacterium]|nr:ATP-binding cassette domain-containing protein [Bacteroidota bacterium]
MVKLFGNLRVSTIPISSYSNVPTFQYSVLLPYKAMIEIINLHKSFGDLAVLSGLTLSVARGETFSILGKSGTGKSVTLKCLVGLLEPDAGEVVVDSTRVDIYSRKALSEIRKKTGFLFQSGALYDSMSVLDNLTFNLSRHHKVTHAEAKEKSEHYLTLVGLSEAIGKMPSELSGGMRKRAALARALVIEPQILLYDEPTTGLDPITSAGISELIRDMQGRFGMTAIVVTHDILCAGIVSDRAGVLKDGLLKYTGTLNELAEIEDEEVKGFFRNPL